MASASHALALALMSRPACSASAVFQLACKRGSFSAGL